VKKFSGFLLVAEPADGLSPETSAGSFQLIGDSLARFSEYCPHAVKHASELPKAEVQVRWTAPPASAGCVSFRQARIEHIFPRCKHPTLSYNPEYPHEKLVYYSDANSSQCQSNGRPLPAISKNMVHATVSEIETWCDAVSV